MVLLFCFFFNLFLFKISFKGEDSVIVCKSDNTAHNYYNPDGHSDSRILSNPNAGIMKIKIQIDNWFTCSFNRLKKFDAENYFDLNNEYYVLAAWGTYDSSSNINKF